MGVPSGEGTVGEGRLGKQSKRKQQTVHTAQTPWQRLPEAYMVGEPSLLSFSVMHLLVFVVCVTKEQNEHQQMRGQEHRHMVALKAALPFESLGPAMCNWTVFEEGAVRWEHFSGADERLTTDWLNTFSPRPLCPTITQSAQSLLPARLLAAGECVLRERRHF